MSVTGKHSALVKVQIRGLYKNTLCIQCVSMVFLSLTTGNSEEGSRDIKLHWAEDLQRQTTFALAFANIKEFVLGGREGAMEGGGVCAWSATTTTST